MAHVAEYRYPVNPRRDIVLGICRSRHSDSLFASSHAIHILIFTISNKLIESRQKGGHRPAKQRLLEGCW